ncbi:glycosyltransferase [Mesorhizobium marinum]|uniref:glycosyltransferase n=1 Tax=Mesorhizobium marinum TaxID=3228790 RepID=UPI003F5C24BE
MIHGGGVLFAKSIRAWRTDVLALPAGGNAASLSGTLYAYSPHVLARPRDWGPDVAVTGYWFLEKGDWTPPVGLAEFLAAGEPPIYVGFGSMPGSDPERLTGLVLDGLRQAGKRGLLATAGGALTTDVSDDRVHVIREAPHDRLFPFVGATLHHGGAGTTGAALRAGKPTAICPFLGDQPFWARRVAALGVGPQPLDKRAMSADDIAAALLAMDDPGMRSRAADLGRAVRAEDGVSDAVRFIEDRLARTLHIHTNFA